MLIIIILIFHNSQNNSRLQKLVCQNAFIFGCLLYEHTIFVLKKSVSNLFCAFYISLCLLQTLLRFPQISGKLLKRKKKDKEPLSSCAFRVVNRHSLLFCASRSWFVPRSVFLRCLPSSSVPASVFCCFISSAVLFLILQIMWYDLFPLHLPRLPFI